MTTEARLVREVHGKNGATRAALYAPHPTLSGCVRAYLSRSITEAAALAPDDRCNHFPPTPTCVFVWLVRGHDSRVPAHNSKHSDGEADLPVVFSGPHTRPSMSENNGPVHFFTLLMYPDAVRSLTGMAIEPHIDRYSDFWALFDADWQAMARAVFHARDDASRVRLIEDFLRPRWDAAPFTPSGQAPAATTSVSNSTVDVCENTHRIGTWSSGIAQRASQHGRELSERQVDRRIKAWTGQNLRQLRGLGRMESALLGVNHTAEQPALGWTELATESGFSDQAHMCREFRHYTGMRPGEMRRSLRNESAWVYRVWA